MRTGGEREHRPAGAAAERATAPPSTPNGAGGRTAALLSLQRSAGNAAVCRVLAGGDEVVRRVWQPDTSDGTWRWDRLVDGLQWFCYERPGRPEIFAFIRKEAAASIDDETDLEAEVFEGKEKTAQEWASEAPLVWRSLVVASGLDDDSDDDVPPPKEQAQPVASGLDDDSDDDTPPPPQQQQQQQQQQTTQQQTTTASAVGGGGGTAQQAPPPARWITALPEVKPAGAPQIRTDRSHIQWDCHFKVKAVVAERSWVVQKVEPLSPRGTTFWEAFPVPAGKDLTAIPDTFFSQVDFGQPGTLAVRGQIRHCVVPGGGPPPGMVAGRVAAAGGAYSSYGAPTGWQDGGTLHCMAVGWDPASTKGAAPKVESQTVPDTRSLWTKLFG